MNDLKMVLFKQIDVLHISKEDWKKYHAFRRKYHSENTPNEPIMSDSTQEEFDRRDEINSDLKIYNYWMITEDLVIGTFYFGYYETGSKNYKGNEKVVRFEIKVLQSYIRKGFGTRALHIMAEACSKLNKSIFITEYQDSSKKPFFESIGAKIVQTNLESRLELNKIDFTLMEAWIQEAETKNPSTKVVVIEGRIPDEIAKEYVKSFDDSIRQMPVDNMQMNRRIFTIESLRGSEKTDELAGVKSITVISIENDGQVSGITNVKILPEREEYLSQGLTGVPLAFRGRKLGKLIKAKMILFIKEKCPNTKAIMTGNANSNAAMLAINTKLGFKKYKELLSAQIYLDDLKKYLESKKMHFSQEKKEVNLEKLKI